MKRLLLALVAVLGIAPGVSRAADRPNIVFIVADDLGYGDLGCYGQKLIRTPNIDRMAAEGMRFTSHYAGSNVCAPSRCVLMTGKHPGHGFIRENSKAKGFPEGQEPVPPGTLQLPLQLRRGGYATGGFGKWALGPVGSTGDPMVQGFGRWYGFNCQARAHNHYAANLWDNEHHVKLDNPDSSAHQKISIYSDVDDPETFAGFSGREYAPDLIAEQSRKFLGANKDRPFFLYHGTTVPHLALQVPEDSLKEYAGKFPEVPYLGDRSYLPHRHPRAAYAAMITRMDREVGRLLALLKELGIDDRTIVVFTSDNGPLYDKLGGTDAEFFNSAGGLRGRKGSFHEGGYRVPCIVRWPGHVAPGRTSDRVVGFEDWLPTLLEIAGLGPKVPPEIDGISFAPTLAGQPQAPRPALYRESPGYGGQQAVREVKWKAIRKDLNLPRPEDRKPDAIELYDLAADPAEAHDLAAKHPEIVARLKAVMVAQHTRSDLFPIRALDGKPQGR